MRKALSWIISLALIFTMAAPAFAAETTAATLRLEKTEGSVTVANAAGKNVTVTEGMRLYSGYVIATEKNGYAYISLDSTKAVKLDASSKAEVQKSGKKLELTATAGKLFFNVSAPVEKDESLNIRTSTMVTGVRGTAGWVEVVNRFTSRVHLLEGTLTVTSSEPATGQMRQATITGGQTATATLKGISQPGSQMALTVTAVQEKLVPGFVAVEVVKDPVLQEKIKVKSPLSVPAIIGGAEERLNAEQKTAELAWTKTEEQLKKIGADEVEQVFTAPPIISGGASEPSPTPVPDPTPSPSPDPEPSVPPTDSVTTEEDLVKALADGKTPINITADITLTNDCTVPSGQTLNIQSGTFTVSAGQNLTVEGMLSNSGTINVAGTMNINSNTNNTNSGTITILSSNSLHIAGTLTNTGTINVGYETAAGLLQVESGGTLSNSGTLFVGDVELSIAGQLKIETDGTLENLAGGRVDIAPSVGSVTNAGTFNNSGDFSVQDGMEFICTKTYNENRSGLYAIVTNAQNAVCYLGLVSEMNWYADTTVKLIGNVKEGDSVSLPALTETGITLDLNGRTMTLSETLVFEKSSGSIGAGDSAEINPDAYDWMITDSVEKGGTLSGQSSVVSVNGGTLKIAGGTVSNNNDRGNGIEVAAGTLNVSGGTVTSKCAGILVSANGTLNMENGTVSSDGGAGIDMSGGIVEISGGTVSSDFGQGVSVSGGTLTMTGGKVFSVSGNGMNVQSDGTVIISGGTVTSTSGSGIYVMESGTLTMTAGTVTSTNRTGIAVASSNGTNSASISGGFVYGGDSGIVNSKSEASFVTISDSAVITLTAELPTENQYAVSGLFTFSGGTLRAKNQANIVDPKLYFVKEALNTGDGYYTVSKDMIIAVKA